MLIIFNSELRSAFLSVWVLPSMWRLHSNVRLYLTIAYSVAKIEFWHRSIERLSNGSVTLFLKTWAWKMPARLWDSRWLVMVVHVFLGFILPMGLICSCLTCPFAFSVNLSLFSVWIYVSWWQRTLTAWNSQPTTEIMICNQVLTAVRCYEAVSGSKRATAVPALSAVWVRISYGRR